MTRSRAGLVRIGDEIRFQGGIYEVGGLGGSTAYLTAAGQRTVGVTLSVLFGDDGFEVVSAGQPRRPLAPSGVFDRLPAEVQEQARWWEAHVTEVIDGRPCTAAAGATVRPEYDVTARTLRQREQAKVDELVGSGAAVTLRAFQKLRLGYESEGLLGLVDKRPIRRSPVTGGSIRGWWRLCCGSWRRIPTGRVAPCRGCSGNWSASSSGHTVLGWWRCRRGRPSTGW